MKFLLKPLFGLLCVLIHKQNSLSFVKVASERLGRPFLSGFQIDWNPAFSKIVRTASQIPSEIPSQERVGNLPKCITNQSEIPLCVVIVVVVNLRLNCLPGVLSWDLGLSNIFGCCLVNSCGGLRKGEPVQSWVHLGKSTMPGCEKGCQIGTL